MKTSLERALEKLDWPDESYDTSAGPACPVCGGPRTLGLDTATGRIAAPCPACALAEVGRDIGVFAPDMHSRFADDAARCETDGDRANVAEHWAWKLCRERRRLSQAEGRE